MFTRTKTALCVCTRPRSRGLLTCRRRLSSTAGSLGSSGALWHRALVLAHGGAKPLQARRPQVDHRLPKATWRGVRPTPLKPPGAADRLVRTLSKVHGLSKAARHKSVAGAPAFPERRRRKLTKNLASASASPCRERPRRGRTSPPP